MLHGFPPPRQRRAGRGNDILETRIGGKLTGGTGSLNSDRLLFKDCRS
jgi:hypothetical protein